jgi:tetratricopeptide (TPR) repeat protein
MKWRDRKSADWRPAILAVAVALLAFLPYAGTGGNEFLDYDDVEYILENPPVLGGLTPGGAAWALTSFHASNWHPLTWISHMADISLFGPSPGRLHLVNAWLHGFNAALLFLLLWSLTGHAWGSVLAALLFGLHPLRVESVAWIAERKDLLCAFFVLLTLLAWRRSLGGGAGHGRWRGASMLLFALALMSKPMAVTLPGLLLVLDFWPLGRWRAVPPSRLGLEKLPFLALSCASAALTLAAQKANDTLASLGDFPPGERLANATASLLDYLVDAFRPTSLAVFYPFPHGGPPAGKVVAAAALLAALLLWLARAWRRYPWVVSGALWYLGMLLPVIGLVQVGYQARADRYTYLPLVGVTVALVWSCLAAADGRRWANRVLAAAGVVVLVTLSALTVRQAALWRDGVTLFEHALRVGGDAWQTRSNLGHAYYDRGTLDRAMLHLVESLRTRPDQPDALMNLGLTLAKSGRVREAIPRYLEAIRLDPGFGKAYFNLGLAYLAIRQPEEALLVQRQLELVDPGWAGRLRSFTAGRQRTGVIPAGGTLRPGR